MRRTIVCCASAKAATESWLQSVESFQGYLYGLERARLVPLAGLPDLEPEPSLADWLTQWVAAEQKDRKSVV